jgi:hypothetical protein
MTRYGRAVAQFGAEALPAHLQVDAGGPRELPEADQCGDDPLAPLLLRGRGDEEEFGDLIDHDHDRHGADLLGQAPDVGRDLRIGGVGADPLRLPDDLEPLDHLRNERFQQIGGGVGVVRQGGEAARQGREFHALLAVDPDQGHRLTRQLLDHPALVDGLTGLGRAQEQAVRDFAEVPVVHAAVLPQRHRNPQRRPLGADRQVHAGEDVVAGHGQLQDAGAQQGFMISQHVPDDVTGAYERLRDHGFTSRLLRGEGAPTTGR